MAAQPRFEGIPLDAQPRFGGIPVDSKPRFGGVPLEDEDSNNLLPPNKVAIKKQASVSEGLRAFIKGAGHGATGLYRGGKQMLGIDEDAMAKDQAVIDALKKDPQLGAYAKAGDIVGGVLDPVALAIPFGRTKTLGELAMQGAKVGGITGTADYVEEGGSRVKNAATGIVGGAVAVPAIVGPINAVRNKLLARKLARMPAEEAATEAAAKVIEATVDTRAVEQLQRVGDDVEQTAREAGVLPAAEPNLAVAQPQGPDGLRAAMEKPGFMRSAEELALVNAARREQPDVVAALETPGLMRTAGQAHLARQSGMVDPAVIGEGKAAIGSLYRRYYADPAWQKVAANPGTAIGGVYGAYGGYNAQEDAPPEQKIKNAAIGAIAGALGMRAIGKIPVRGTTLGDATSRAVVDNYNLPDTYVGIKRAARTYESQALGPFADLAREGAKLPREERKLLYAMLTGEAPSEGALGELSDQARARITEMTQRYIDAGILDPETAARNADTYVHRSYTPKDSKKYPGKAMRFIADTLKPRGIQENVSPEIAQKRLKDGWEVFGKGPRGTITVRRQLTKEEREAKGEIDDFTYAMAETGRLMARDTAAAKFYQDIAKEPTLASAAPVEGWVPVKESRVPGTRVDRMGALEGMYVDPDVYADLKMIKNAQNIRQMPGIKQYLEFNRLWKMSKTALNPVVHFNNVASNIPLYDFAGGRWPSLMSGAKMLHDAKRGQPHELLSEAERAGVFEAGFLQNEVRGLKDDVLKEFMRHDSGDAPIRTAADIARKTWGMTGGKMASAYEAEDKVFRLGLYITRRQQGASVDEAAQDARKWFIDYDINAPLINAMRNTTHPFLAFSYRAMPLVAETAVKRPWKLAKWAALGAALNAAGEKYGGGDTEKERKLFTQRQRGNLYGVPGVPAMIKLPIGQETRDRHFQGLPQYLDATRLVPGGDIVGMAESSVQNIPYLPAPLQVSGGGAGQVFNALKGYDAFTGKTLPGLGLSREQDAKIKGKALVQGLMPNIPGLPGSYSTSKIKAAIHGVETPFTDRVEPWQAMLQSIGPKVMPADIPKMKLRLAYERKQREDAIRKLMTQATISYVNARNSDMSPADKAQAKFEFERTKKDLSEQAKEIAKIYRERMR